MRLVHAVGMPLLIALSLPGVDARQVPVGRPAKEPAAVAPEPPAVHNWVTYAPGTAEFMMSFPGEPKLTTSVLRNGQPMNVASVVTDSYLFTFAWTEIPPNLRGGKTDIASLLKNYVAGMAPKLQVDAAEFTYNFAGPLSSGGHPGGEMYVTSTQFDGRILTRAFVTSGSFYVACAVPLDSGDANSRSSASQFLESLAVRSVQP